MNKVEDYRNTYPQAEFPFLAIKNWEKYQQVKLGERATWIKDYWWKESDIEYSRKTCTQRYLLDALRRLVVKEGHFPYNDPKWIARSLFLLEQDARFLVRNISLLIAEGMLIPTKESFELGPLIGEVAIEETLEDDDEDELTKRLSTSR